MKAPKRIESPSEIEPRVARSGSAWNSNGTTWEDKDVTSWATKTLERYLNSASAHVPGASFGSEPSDKSIDETGDHSEAVRLLFSPLLVRVKNVSSCAGTASLNTSRGTLRRGWDYTFKLDWEVESTDTPGKAVCEGTLEYVDVTSCVVPPSSVKITFKEKGPSDGKFTSRLHEAVKALQGDITKSLENFTEELGKLQM